MGRCKRCGKCCEGQPRLNDDDIEKIAAMGYAPEFYIEKVSGVKYVKVIDGKCMFLGRNEEGHFCKIYSARPRICVLYPGSKVKNCEPENWFFDINLEKQNRELFGKFI